MPEVPTLSKKREWKLYTSASEGAEVTHGKGALQLATSKSSTWLQAMKRKATKHPRNVTTTGKLNPKLANTNLVT